MSKIMEQPIVDYIRTSLHTNGFPLPAVVKNEEHFIVYEQDSYSTVTCIMLFTAKVPHDKEIPTYLILVIYKTPRVRMNTGCLLLVWQLYFTVISEQSESSQTRINTGFFETYLLDLIAAWAAVNKGRKSSPCSSAYHLHPVNVAFYLG